MKNGKNILAQTVSRLATRWKIVFFPSMIPTIQRFPNHAEFVAGPRRVFHTTPTLPNWESAQLQRQLRAALPASAQQPITLQYQSICQQHLKAPQAVLALIVRYQFSGIITLAVGHVVRPNPVQSPSLMKHRVEVIPSWLSKMHCHTQD